MEKNAVISETRDDTDTDRNLRPASRDSRLDPNPGDLNLVRH